MSPSTSLNCQAALEECVAELLAEPLAAQEKLSDLTLLEASEHLITLRRQLLETDELSAELALDQTSLENCWDALCGTLQLLELQGYEEIPDKPLSQLTSETQIHQFLAKHKALTDFASSPDGLEVPLTEMNEKGGLAEISLTPSEFMAEEPTLLSTAMPLNRFLNERAQEFLNLSHHFESLSSDPSSLLQGTQGRKLTAQFLCQALELEEAEVLKAPLAILWSERDEAVRALFQDPIQLSELKPELKQGFLSLPERFSHLIIDQTFPLHMVSRTFRYLLGLKEASQFEPTLLEVGVLLFLFGQADDFNGFTLSNPLHLSMGSFDEAAEFLFRSLRIQKLKGRLQNAQAEFSEEELALIQEDAKALIESLHKLTFFDASATDKEVA